MGHALPPTVMLSALAVLGLATASPLLAAGGIDIRILDRDGLPVPEVVVTARRIDAEPEAATGGAATRMNQHALAFEPHILIVQVGTAVEFPNADDVRHHVYSFSPARQFNFSIESGAIHESLRFNVPGIVTLGCNIHDDMLAYIVVVDTPHFAKTGPDGTAELTGLDAGRYELAIWSSRIAQKHQPEPIGITVTDGAVATSEHRFEAKLHPPHRHSETSLQWADY
jgi:plastocyanin